MAYATIEAAVQTLLQALAQYTSDQVTRGDYRVLDSGVDEACVLRPGAFTVSGGGDYGQRTYGWLVYVQIFQRYTGDGSEWASLATQRQNVVDQLHEYPTVDGVAGVTEVVVTRGREPGATYPRGSDTPDYLTQVLELRVVEKRVHTLGETG